MLCHSVPNVSETDAMRDWQVSCPNWFAFVGNISDQAASDGRLVRPYDLIKKRK